MYYSTVIAIPRFIAGKVNLKENELDVIVYIIQDRQGGLEPPITVEDSRVNTLEAFYAWKKVSKGQILSPDPTCPEDKELYEAINLPAYIEYVVDEQHEPKIIVMDIPSDQKSPKARYPFWGSTFHLDESDD